MRTVFLDTVGLLALWDESDQWSEGANRAYGLLRQRPTRLVTTSLILFECGNAAARRPYREEVVKLWNLLDRAGNLTHPTTEQVQASWGQYSQRGPGSASIVDLVSFAVMRDLGIMEAFTNDSHFRAEGFITLIQT